MSGRSPWESPSFWPARMVPGNKGVVVPAYFTPVEQEEIRAICLQAIEDLFPKLCQAMKQIMESAQSLLPEKDPVKLDRQLRTLGILPRQQPGLSPEQGPHMHVYKLSEELNASPDEAQEALDVLEALGYVAHHKLTPGAIPGYVLTF